MRLFINESHFISVIKDKNKFSCQVMELINGMGMTSATFFQHPENIISGIISDNTYYSITSMIEFETLEGVFDFHKLCLREWLRHKELEDLKKADY